MRALMIGLALSCCAVACDATLAEDPTVEPREAFTVTNYQLAFVHVGQHGDITNEYTPRGESLESWTTLIAVRQWPQARELAEITGPYIRRLQPMFVRDAQVYRPEGSAAGTDVVIECYLAPADKSYLEYNLIRFTREPGTTGVKSYQFAVKGEYDLDAAVEFNKPRLKSRLDTIAGLKLAATSEPLAKPDDQSGAVTNDTGRDDE